jgi:hypothetical protein
MKLLAPRSAASRGPAASPARWLALGVVVMLLGLATTADAATSVPLGTAKRFAVLAGSGITITGPTTITGDIGTYPTTSMTVTGALTLNGTDHAGDLVTQQAKKDLVTAFNNAAAQSPTGAITADLGGQTLTPGVYHSASSIGLTGTLTLDGGGNPGAVFIFQAQSSTLTTAPGSSVLLINGAQACNVFWEIGSSATLDTTTDFSGTILALTSITANTGAIVHGRLLARNGAVTLDTNTVTRPSCASSGPTPSPSPSGSPQPTPTPGGSPSPGASPTSGGSPTPAQVNSHPTPSPPRNSFGLTG